MHGILSQGAPVNAGGTAARPGDPKRRSDRRHPSHGDLQPDRQRGTDVGVSSYARGFDCGDQTSVVAAAIWSTWERPSRVPWMPTVAGPNRTEAAKSVTWLTEARFVL